MTGGSVTGDPNMGAVVSERDVRRAQRWLEESGDMWPVPSAAGELLARRLAARHRMKWRVMPVVVGAAALWLVWWVPGSPWETEDMDASRRWSAVSLLGVFCLMCVAFAVADRVERAADRAIAAVLPVRVQREEPAPLRVVLGVPGTVSLVAVIVMVALEGVMVWATQPAGFAAGVSSLLLVQSGVCWAGLRSTVTRRSVALDPVSLAMDERLRSQDAWAQVPDIASPLVVLLQVPLGPAHEPWWLVQGLGLIVFVGAAMSSTYWRPWLSRRPLGWAVPLQVVGPEPQGSPSDTLR